MLMPCLNKALDRRAFKGSGLHCPSRARAEVVVADSGSTDGSPQSRREGARVVHVPERGWGRSVSRREGRSRPLHHHGDGAAADFSRLDPFVEQLRVGMDLVMGNRLGRIAPERCWKNKHPAAGALPHRRLFFSVQCRTSPRVTVRARPERMGSNDGDGFVRMVSRLLCWTCDRKVPTTLSKDGRDRRRI